MFHRRFDRFGDIGFAFGDFRLQLFTQFRLTLSCGLHQSGVGFGNRALRVGAASDDAPAEDQPEEAIEEVTEDQAQDAAPAEDTGAEEAAGQEKED